MLQQALLHLGRRQVNRFCFKAHKPGKPKHAVMHLQFQLLRRLR
jgi:hypothetical protein